MDDKSAVARWSEFCALTEIAKNNPGIQKKMIQEIQEILQKEKNWCIRNVYIKALESLGEKKD